MLPLEKVQGLISKHSKLEKDLSSGEIDKNTFAEKSKEYSDLSEIIKEAREYNQFEKNKSELENIINDTSSDKEMKDLAEKELAEYFQGKRRVFSLPFVQTGTAFELAVWSVLIDIPYGRTMSYKMQAEKMARAQAFRAVGTANGKNPLPIIVPCHRGLRSDFGLGGYAGGLWMKEWLLAHEKKHC